MRRGDRAAEAPAQLLGHLLGRDPFVDPGEDEVGGGGQADAAPEVPRTGFGKVR